MSVDHNILTLLYSALAATEVPGQYGISIAVSSVAQARVKVSTTRKAHGDPALAVLECRASPIVPNELWIIKRGLIPPDPSEILDDLLAEED